MVQEIIFNGPAGRLEAKYHQNPDPQAPSVLILHPHPLHGGTMNNKVVYNMFYTFLQRNFSVLRFNFRGVGKSTGSFDNGIGELTDAGAALDWLQAHNPQSSSCWVAGFSFGAWIALQLLMRRPEISGFIAVSPPANSYDFNFLSPCPSQGVIIQGTKDTVVSEEAVYSLYEKLSKQKDANVEYVPISGADHFYTNHLPILTETLQNYVENRLRFLQKPRKVKRDRRRRQAVGAESA